MSLPEADRVKIWLTLVILLPETFPQYPLPVDLSVGDIRWQLIAAELLEITVLVFFWRIIVSQWNWRTTEETPSLFRIIPSLTLPYNLPFPQNGAPNAHLDPRTNFATRAAGWRYRQGSYVLCLMSMLLLGYFGPCSYMHFCSLLLTVVDAYEK